MKRVVFLDFDGVLDRGAAPGDPQPVAHLNRITDASSAVLVVHSTWRHGRTQSALREILESWGVTGHLHAVCRSEDPSRAGVIQAWIDDHSSEIERFVILDDCRYLGHFVGHPAFIRTTFRVGLTAEHAQAAIEHLMK